MHIPYCALPPECDALRAEVRQFLGETLPDHCNAVPQTLSAFDAEFSQKLGARGKPDGPVVIPQAEALHPKSLRTRAGPYPQAG